MHLFDYDIAMHLTRYSDYALRVLMYLGMRDDRLSTIHEIATQYGISENHLTKVVHQLGRAGLIKTIRGRNGGLQLGKPPARINVGKVVRLTEADFGIVECFNRETNKCVLQGACVLQKALSEALAAFLAVLDGYTLADLLEPGNRLAKRLLAAP